MTSFESFDLLPSILKQLKAKGYTTPTPIQEESIPHLLAGRDLLGIAQTGSGKTAAFSLPILDYFGRNKVVLAPNQIRSLILTPTRELATQIDVNITQYGEGLDLKTKVIYGGVSNGPQISALEKGVDILVATPGRLLDLVRRGHVDFKHVEFFVLDEADMMLNMGFLNDVLNIISQLPEDIQTLMFSATMPPAIEKLSRQLLNKPAKIEVDSESTIVETVDQKLFTLDKKNKGPLLLNLLKDEKLCSVLLFCKTKLGGDIIVEMLDEASIPCGIIHSNKSQQARENALMEFQEGTTRVLVATDVAARGIDIKNISHVINFNLPEDPTSYIHRIGRTARAGKDGVAISFCVPSEVSIVGKIENSIKQKIKIEKNQPFHREFSTDVKAIAKKMKTKAKKKKHRGF